MKNFKSRQSKPLKVKKSKVNLYLLYFIILGSFSFLIGQETIQITGKIVNNEGDSIANAQISLLPAACKQCPLDVIETFTSDEQGDFSASLKPKTKYYIFTEEEAPRTYWKAVNFPSGTIRYLSEYKGTPVLIDPNPANDIIDVGDVETTVRYFKTEIDLRRFTVGNSLKDQITRIQTKDYNGRIVSSKRTVSEKYFSDSSKIKLVLPKGAWILDVFSGEEEKEKKVGSVKVIVRSEANIKKTYF